MPHMINPLVDTVYTPDLPVFCHTWHSMNDCVEGEIALDGSNVPHSFNPILDCQINPQLPEGFEMDETTSEEMKKWKLIIADCRQGKSGKVHPLHVPKEGYAIHDNKLLFDCMVKSASNVLGQNGFKIVTVGTLDSYKQFFVSIAIGGHESFEMAGNDRWFQYFNLISSHNGLVSSSRMLSMIRMVCMNTVQASISESEANGTRETIRHSKNSLELITPEIFESDLNLWINQSNTMKQAVSDLQAVSMNCDDFKSFACGVFTASDSEKISTTTFNRISDLESLFVRGKGNHGQSAYDALNAFTEYFTHGNGIGKKASDAQKIARANFGRGNDWKKEAFRILTDDVEMTEASERGERLLNEYLDEKKSKE